MKKTVLTILALCLCMLGGMVASGSAATTVSKTKVKLTFAKGTPPYGESAFSGKVKGKKVCRKKRKVKIKGVGKAKTNKKGAFTIAASSSLPPGKYVAKVKKKTIKKGRDVIVCKKGKSKKVTVS